MPAIELNLYRDNDCLRPADQASMMELDRIPVGKRMICTIAESKRTDQQRKAIEVYCRLLAEALDNAGYTITISIGGHSADVSPSQSSVKENIWRVFQMALLDKKSTTNLSTDEVSKVYKEVSGRMAMRFGVNVPFPSYT